MKARKLGIALALFALVAARHSFPDNAAEFSTWQATARAELMTALFNGPVPERVPLDAAWGKTEDRQTYRLHEVSFSDRPGHRTHGWLARPLAPRAARLPVIISLHGHGGTGIQTFDPDRMYFYGDLFARQGYLVLAIDIGHEAIDIDRNLQTATLPKKVPFPYNGQKVWMVMRAIDLAQSLPDADPDSIGIVGLSNGGFTSLFAIAVEPRIKAAVCSGNLVMHDRMWHRELVHCRCQYLEGIDGRLDYYDLAALFAPRPLLFQSGEEDGIFPVNSARRAFGFVTQAYALSGAPEHTAHDIHPGKHEFRGEAPLEWFGKWLPIGK